MANRFQRGMQVIATKSAAGITKGARLQVIKAGERGETLVRAGILGEPVWMRNEHLAGPGDPAYEAAMREAFEKSSRSTEEMIIGMLPSLSDEELEVFSHDDTLERRTRVAAMRELASRHEKEIDEGEAWLRIEASRDEFEAKRAEQEKDRAELRARLREVATKKMERLSQAFYEPDWRRAVEIRLEALQFGREEQELEVLLGERKRLTLPKHPTLLDAAHDLRDARVRRLQKIEAEAERAARERRKSERDNYVPKKRKARPSVGEAPPPPPEDPFADLE